MALSNKSTSSPDLKMQINELLKISNALGVDEGDPSESSEQAIEGDTILLKNLPMVLAEFEKEKGRALLNEEARPVLDSYVEANPELILKADSLHEMINALNASREDTEGDPIGVEYVPRRVLRRERIEDRNETSESGTDISTEEDESLSDDHQELTGSSRAINSTHKSNSRSQFDFPRSQSERMSLSLQGKEVDEMPNLTSSNLRKKTTSDPSAPFLQSQSLSEKHSKSRTERRKSGETGGDRDVLRGKGKAKVPPSSWSNARPKPPAFAKRERNRRISDISSNYSETSLQEDLDEDYSPIRSSTSLYGQLGNGLPSDAHHRPIRQRLLSQPELRQESHSGVTNIPRSASSITPGSANFRTNESYHDGSSGSWTSITGESRSSPTPRSDNDNVYIRGNSPVLDESSYHNFSALSPTLPSGYFVSPTSPTIDVERVTSRGSSVASRRRDMEEGDETLMTNDTTSALLARLEAVQKILSDKERQHDAVQEEHEMFISRLQDELEETKSEVNTRKREDKESKSRENSHLDTIASLEADLNQTEKVLEMTRDLLAKTKADYEEQVDESSRLRLKMKELQQELEKAKLEEQSHNEAFKSWDMDREVYREKINGLHAHVDEVEAEISRLQEGERENKLLKEHIERLSTEMEDLRRGSSLRSSRIGGSDTDGGTLSKRLGSELAKQLASSGMLSNDDIYEEEEEMEGEEDGEESFTISMKKKIRKIRGAMQDKQIGPSESSDLPTYDEAAMEKQVIDRLHPRVDATLNGDIANKDLDVDVQMKDSSYLAITEKAGLRCTVLETKLKVYETANRSISTADSNESNKDTSIHSRSIRENWTNSIFQHIARLPDLSPSKSFLNSNKEDSKRQQQILSLFAISASLLFFLLGLWLGMGYPLMTKRKTPSLHILEDFGISKSLGLFEPATLETKLASQSSWYNVFFFLRDSTTMNYQRVPT